MNQLLHGDCNDKLKEIESNSVDFMGSDPQYGYSFMNKDWDKALVPVETWKECLRVLKPGAFAYIMCAPRQDVHARMVINLQDAGFKVDFTSIFWAYASGFPKAGNISKMVDKKLGLKPIQGKPKPYTNDAAIQSNNYSKGNYERIQCYETTPNSDQAKKLDGSYAGFQPKPALEIILVVMKPLTEKIYVDQAMKNSHGITWLDDCRIPFVDQSDIGDPNRFEGNVSDLRHFQNDGRKTKSVHVNDSIIGEKGRFPANLLVSDDALNDGKNYKVGEIKKNHIFSKTNKFTYSGEWKPLEGNLHTSYGDSGSFSRYFDEDAWQAQFLIVEKPSKSEKNAGLKLNKGSLAEFCNWEEAKGVYAPNIILPEGYSNPNKNDHPTVKPISLMSYLITMGSRKGDIVLDPFAGSGSTLIAASLLERNYIGIDLDSHNCIIMKNRLDYWKDKTFEKLEKIKKQVEKQKIVKLEEFCNG